MALTEACTLGIGKCVNIYTDSRYAFVVVHDFGTLWKQRHFLTSSGAPYPTAPKCLTFFRPFSFPPPLRFVNVQHTQGKDPVSTGKARVNGAAKAAAFHPAPTSQMMVSLPVVTLPFDPR